MSEEKERFYVAYGSNLNVEQMGFRCPTAQVVGIGEISGYELLFRGGQKSSVATIELKEGESVPVAIWSIQPEDEKNLDIYEGYPRLYRKEEMNGILDGEEVPMMVYVMNGGRAKGLPSERYYSIIRQGYDTFGFDVGVLEQAEQKSAEAVQEWNMGEHTSFDPISEAGNEPFAAPVSITRFTLQEEKQMELSEPEGNGMNLSL